jgi:hypothetical protein
MTLEWMYEYGSKWTFQMPKLRAWVEGKMEGDCLNLFGGITRLNSPEGGSVLHNELNPDLPADVRKDACDLIQWQDMAGRFDTVVFDPPYSAFQAVKSYGIKKAQLVTHARDVVMHVLKPKGRVITLAFNSTGMSKSRGFEKENLLIINCGASHNDYICLVERRIQNEVEANHLGNV